MTELQNQSYDLSFYKFKPNKICGNNFVFNLPSAYSAKLFMLELIYFEP